MTSGISFLIYLAQDWLFVAQREGHRSDDARNPVATSTNNVPLNR